MSIEKINKILATYPPVDGKPGYVWLSKQNYTIIKYDLLKEAYLESFQENSNSTNDSNKS